ncbi:PHB depolymerase family esterase [Cupriavidus sp. AU9028]|nr:PHB depolymerase family esterase [Cupriavidus sp. AU9028]
MVGRSLARTLTDAANGTKAATKAAAKASATATRPVRSPGRKRSASKGLAATALAASSSQAEALRRAFSGVASPVPAPNARAGGRWIEGSWGSSPLTLRHYRLYLPQEPSRAAPAPLLVLLHGCAQDAGSFAVCTRAAAFARQRGCMVLLPEQSSRANPNRCWNWFRGEAIAAAEASLLMAIVDHVGALYPVRGSEIYLLGLSAGGAMAQTMALRYPDRFAAVGSHSGAVPHVASNATEAARVMRGAIGQPSAAQMQALQLRLAGRTPPPLLLLHGDADRVVAFDNAAASVNLWLMLSARSALRASAPRTIQRGTRRAITVLDWRHDGRPYVRLVRIDGMGHAWSGGPASQAYADPAGPDALRLAFAFFDAAAPVAAEAGAGRRAVA